MSEDLEQRRDLEIAKYDRCYQKPNYHMGQWRQDNFRFYLTLHDPNKNRWKNFIDVACGRGETLAIASAHGLTAMGVEVIPYLCDHKNILCVPGAHDLSMFPDKSFDLVSNQDVMEHILEDEVEVVLAELWRITRKTLFLTISSHPHSVSDGDNLHITVKPKDWWMDRLCEMACIVDGMENETIRDLSAEMPSAIPRQCSYFEINR